MPRTACTPRASRLDRQAHYLAIRCAPRAAAFHIATDGLHQETLAALWRATQRFDPARGCKFINLAHLVIRLQLERFLTVAGRDRAVPLGDLGGLLPAPADPVDRLDVRQRVAHLLARLDARSRAIVVERYGLDGRGGKTYAQLGARYRMTAERVRQVLAAALAKMVAVARQRGTA